MPTAQCSIHELQQLLGMALVYIVDAQSAADALVSADRLPLGCVNLSMACEEVVAMLADVSRRQ
jgi:hypothetical protein